MESSPITPSPELKRLPTLGSAMLLLAGVAALIGVGFGVYRVRLEVLLLIATVISAGWAKWLGLGWREMQSGIVQNMMKGMPAMLIVLAVGALIASWLAAGTIPMIVYYGLGLISPRFFLVTASIATGVVSVLTGTGYGTIGTVGVAFMGIAHGLGVPEQQAAGALVAGAYLGHKISPFAANANLAVVVARVNIYDHIRHCLWTTVPALAVGLAVYGYLGLSTPPTGATSLAVGEQLRATLAANFTFTPWLLIPPLIMMVGAGRRRPVLPGMLLSVSVAVVLAVVVQHQPLTQVLNALATGYRPSAAMPLVEDLLAQGGMLTMMNVTLIALCAFAFSGILQKAGLLQPVLQKLFAITTDSGRLVSATAAACLAVAAMTGSAFVCILLPTELFAPSYRRLGLAAKNLSRTICDSGIVAVPLIPWSIAGAFMSGTLGVRVSAYAPWAIFCYAGLGFTVLAGFTAFAMAPLKNVDETQPGS